MSKPLTDAQVIQLLASDPSDAILLRELRDRVRRQVVRALPSPEGTCPHGLLVRQDDKGAYSSGYWYHVRDTTTCFESVGTTVDVHDRSPRAERLHALLESIR